MYPAAPRSFALEIDRIGAVPSMSGVMQIVQAMRPGGIETMALDLARDGELAGPIVSLAGDRDSLVAAWPGLASSSARLIALDQGPVRPWTLVRRLVRLMRAERPRAVILHHIGPLLHGGLAARLAGVPRIVHIEHDAWHYADPKHRLIAKACDWLVRPSRVAVSDEIATRVRELLPSSRFSVIAPGIDTTRFVPAEKAAARARLGIPAEARVVGTVGRMVEVKGHSVLLDAMAQLTGGELCVLVGDGPDRVALEAQAHRLGIADRVRFLGLRSDAEAVVPAFDVFCLPSFAEGLPRALLEAQSCGVPVVASNVGGVARAIAPGGRLVSARDAEALADAVRAAFAARPDPQTTRDFVVATFSLAATVRALRDVISDQS